MEKLSKIIENESLFFDEGRRDNMMTRIIEIMRTSRFINFVILKMMKIVGKNWLLDRK